MEPYSVTIGLYRTDPPFKKHLLSVRIFCNFTILRSLHLLHSIISRQRLSVRAANLHIAVIHLAGNAFKRQPLMWRKQTACAARFLGTVRIVASISSRSTCSCRRFADTYQVRPESASLHRMRRRTGGPAAVPARVYQPIHPVSAVSPSFARYCPKYAFFPDLFFRLAPVCRAVLRFFWYILSLLIAKRNAKLKK